MKRKSIVSHGSALARMAILALLACLASPDRTDGQGRWIPLSNQPGNAPWPNPGIEVGTMLLLSDGTVMAEVWNEAPSTAWFRLTPSNTGGYTNGLWTSRSSMNYSRLYYSSDVLPNGKVFIAGAEYGNGTTNAELYDPVLDSWSIIPIPAGIINTSNFVNSQGENNRGFIDSGSVVLSTGNVLVEPVWPAVGGYTTIYDPVTGGWSNQQLQHGGDEDEASTVKLPDNSILVVDSEAQTVERFIPSLGQWVDDANCPVDLFDIYGKEEGAGFLLPNGKAFFIGSTPVTAIYTPSPLGGTNYGTWQQGPAIPQNLGAPDAPAAMMVNGKILCALSPTPFGLNQNQIFTTPTYFYLYDYSVGSVGAFIPIPSPTGGTSDNVATYAMRMLDLPDGTVLFSDGITVYDYIPDSGPLTSGQPTIASVSWNADGSLLATGTLFNGISQGAGYGDDAQMDSNYPLISLLNLSDGTGDVDYATTFNWSSTGVQTGSTVVSTEFNLPPGLIPDTYSLAVIANGISSAPVTFLGPAWVNFNYGGSIQNGSQTYPFPTLAQGIAAVPTYGNILIQTAGNSAETMTISKPMTIMAVGGPATIGN